MKIKCQIIFFRLGYVDKKSIHSKTESWTGNRYRAVFKLLTIVISPLLRLVIGSKMSRPFFNQRGAKPIASCTVGPSCSRGGRSYKINLFILWLVIYPMDRVIHHLNHWGLNSTSFPGLFSGEERMGGKRAHPLFDGEKPWERGWREFFPAL